MSADILSACTLPAGPEDVEYLHVCRARRAAVAIEDLPVKLLRRQSPLLGIEGELQLYGEVVEAVQCYSCGMVGKVLLLQC